MKKEKDNPKVEKVVSRKITKSLPCKLKDDEVLKYGRDLARAHAELDRINNELDSIKADYKGKISEQDSLIGKLSVRVHSGVETREVECEELRNWTKARLSVIRKDTGEVIEDRPMREDEKQMEVSLSGALDTEAVGNKSLEIVK